MCDVKEMERSYVLAEHSILRKKSQAGFMISAVFYRDDEQRNDFLNRMKETAGLDVHVINTLTGLQHACNRLINSKSYIVDLGTIENNLDNKHRIIVDEWIKTLLRCGNGKKIDIIFLKDITDEYFVMNVFQPCDMLLKL